MKNYIQSKRELQKGSYSTISAINIVVADDLLFDLSYAELEETLKSFPRHFLTDIDYIIFGNFDFLRKNNYNASYKDGAIYVLNNQENNAEILDDIVHEIGHSVEEKYDNFIYSDLTVEKEFLRKRKLLKAEFEKEGIDAPSELFSKIEYDRELDNMFANEVGYPVMTTISQGIFYSPYGATSLREYFANGFEAYFYHKDLYLKKVSPILFSKLEDLEIGGKLIEV